MEIIVALLGFHWATTLLPHSAQQAGKCPPGLPSFLRHRLSHLHLGDPGPMPPHEFFAVQLLGSYPAACAAIE